MAKGSLRNKLLLVPAALAVSFVAPWLITPVLMLGGLFLCYEGFEKLAHSMSHAGQADAAQRRDLLQHVADPAVDLVAYEQKKIRGAVRTDFILSAEIIVLTLGIVADSSFATQVLTVSGIALLMTVGVYGLVAGIVKMDDAGLHLASRTGEGAWPALLRRAGHALVSFAPWLMKALGVVGTIAMFMVGGGILVHGFHGLEGLLAALQSRAAALPLGDGLAAAAGVLGPIVIGLLAGAAVLLLVSAGQRLRALF